MTMLAVQTPVDALADSLHGLDARIHAPLDEVPALRLAWAESLIERLQARGFDVVATGQVALTTVGGTE